MRLHFELRDSADPAIQAANPQICTGRKWNASKAVDQAVERLKHQEIVGFTQSGRSGLGWAAAPKSWSKATKKERKDLVISEVAKMEEETYKITAVSQQQQGRWTTWEAVTNRTITWADMWRTPQARLSFRIRATYDNLPSPRNLLTWFGTEEPCHLCSSPNPNLKHILSGCKTALSQGRYRWRHDKVLRKLAETLEARRQQVNRENPPTSPKWIQFTRPGTTAWCCTGSERSLLSLGGQWQLAADLSRQLKFPAEITMTSLRPDIMLWSAPAKAVIMVELTVPWEEHMEAAYERKKDKYTELAATCSQAGWRPFTFPVEVGCRGFTGTSTQRLLKTLGVTGPNRKRALHDLAEEAEEGSFWLWLRRKDRAWGKEGS